MVWQLAETLAVLVNTVRIRFQCVQQDQTNNVKNGFKMIWSYLKSALGFVLPGSFFNDKDDDENWEEEEKEILNEINNFENVNIDDLKTDSCEDLLGYANREGGPSENLKINNYLCKTGTVTFICSNYGLIDNKVYFDLDCVSQNMLINKNDKVSYITVDSVSHEPAKVIKVCALSNESWDPFGSQNATVDSNSFTKLEAMHRLVNGKVTKLEERKFFVEPHNIWCNMDKIEISFQPIEGDWVSLEALVTINDNVHNGVGEVLEILSAKPSVTQIGTGRITFWVDGKNEGVINSAVDFSKTVCGDFYIPTLGDLVSYEAIESDRGKLKWRAVWVKPEKLKLRENGERKLFKNKKGIVITQSSHVLDLKLNETKEVIVEVINRGEKDRTLLQAKFFKWDTTTESQLSLKSPNLTEKYTFKPSERLKFVVLCSGKVLGSTGELLEFHFEKFRIAKSFEINVLTDDYVDEVSRSKSDKPKQKKAVKRITGPIEGNVVLFGNRPFHCHRFFKMVAKENYEIPKTLWRIMLGPGDVPKSSVEVMSSLRKSLPYLASALSPETYVKRFRTLLHLEEMSIKIKFTSYAIVEAVLEHKDSFWFIEVSGLAEGRPSILQGDRVIVTRPWLSKVTHIGFVHKVENNGIYVDFHLEFRLNYQGEKCDVRFVPNMATLVKCHRAIGRAFNEMGKDWLFPSKVIEKPDIISFEVADEPANAVNGSLGNGEKKRLVWQNKNLNERQKMAVVNILKGRARPLPYIIFGPPGTGKTTTVFEAVIQVFTLMPNTRLLVCGPSNSSVDLLAEKLIDSGLFKPGELIRLYAVSRLQLIPEKVAPYSECVGLRTDPVIVKESVMKVKVSRITLGTFSSIGVLNALPSLGIPFFSHVFIDEAGQMTEPETMIPVCLLHKEKSQLVLAGDPKQLGPVCSSLIAANFDFERSFLERLISIYPYKPDRKAFPETSGFDPRLVTKLNYNYRSLPEIINLPNQLFYDSDLIPLISDEDSFEAKLLKSLDIKVSKREKNPAIIFHGIVGKNLQERNSPSWFNPQEIWQLVIYLRKLYKSGLTADDVGIVTPYTKQVEKCRSVLASVNLAVPEVGTVNKFQGQEKHVIILTVVRSCIEVLKKDMMFSLGFVASPRRLNVALTRARTLLIILGNPNLLSVDPYWEKVIEYCVQNKSYVGCNLKFSVKQFSADDQKENSDSEENCDEDSPKKEDL